MPIRFRRTVRVAPGVRLNVTKTGLGVRVGPRGVGLSAHSSGRVTASAGVPGSGLYFRKERQVSRTRVQPEGRGRPEGSTLPVGQDLRRLRRDALRDHRRGGGPALERLWQLTSETFDRGLGKMGADLAAENAAQLDKAGRQALVATLADAVPVGTSLDAVPAQACERLLDDENAASSLEHPNGRWAKQLRELIDPTSVEGLAEQHLRAADELIDGMPFALEWLEQLERDAPKLVLRACLHELCTGVLANDLSTKLGEQAADESVADVIDAYSLLSHASPRMAARAAVLARRAERLQEWPPTEHTVTLGIGEHLHLELPIDTIAVSCAALRAAHLLGEQSAARHNPEQWSTVELLIAVHDWWLEGAADQLAALEAPEPTDDVSALVCVYLAAGIAEQHPDDALELLDAAVDAANSKPIRAEALLHRAWVRRTAGDGHFERDIAAVRHLAPDHPGLWALPELDRPAPDQSTSQAAAHDAAAAVYAATFPHWPADEVQAHTRSLVANVISRVIVADGQLSLHEEQLWGVDAFVTEVAGMVQATEQHAPEKLAEEAARAHVEPALLDRFVDAVIALAQHSALIDGEVDVSERDLVAQLQRRLRGAISSTTGTHGTDGGMPVGGRDSEHRLRAAAECVVTTGLASATMVARKLEIDTELARELMAALQALGAVGPSPQSGIPEVLWNPDDLRAAQQAGVL